MTIHHTDPQHGLLGLFKGWRGLFGALLLLFSGLAGAATTINEQFNPQLIDQGDISRYTISLTNDSATALTNAMVTVVLDNTSGAPKTSGGNITIASGTVISNTCNFPPASIVATAGTSKIVLTGGTVPARINESTPSICTFSLDVTSTKPGTYNTYIPGGTAGVFTPPPPDVNTPGYAAQEGATWVTNSPVGGSDGSATVSLQINFLLPPTVIKSYSPSTAIAGDPTTLTITLTNPNVNSTMPLTSFADTLPVNPASPGSLKNMVVADPANASVSCTGDGVVGTFSPSPGDAALTLTGGTIGKNGTCTLSVKVIVPTLTSTSQVFNNSLDAGDIGNTRGLTSPPFSTPLTVNSPIGVSKVFDPATIPAGQPSKMTITIANNSTINPLPITSFVDNLTGTTIKVLDASSTPAQTNPAVSCTGTGTAGTLNYTPNALDKTLTLSDTTTVAPGKSCTITAFVTSAADGSHDNTIAADAVVNSAGHHSPAKIATLNVNAQLTVNKTVSPGSVAPGQWATFTVTIRNWSGAPVTNVSFRDTLPVAGSDQMVLDGVNPVSSVGCTGGTWTGSDGALALQWTLGTVPAGSGASPGVCTIVFKARLPDRSPAITTLVFDNQIPASNGSGGTCGAVGVCGTGTGPGGIVLNPAASPAASVTEVDAVAVSKSFSPNAIAQGGLSTLTLTLRNRVVTGNLTGIKLEDRLPTGLRLADNPAPTNSCGGTLQAYPGDTVVKLTGGSITARDSGSVDRPCQITVKVTGATVGSYENTIPPNQFASSGGTIPAPAEGKLTINTGLTGSKTFSPNSVTPGGKSRVTIRVTNGSNGDLTNVSVDDDFSSSTGLTVANPANAGSSCAGSPTLVANPGTQRAQLLGATLTSGASCDFSFDVLTKLGTGPWTNTIGIGKITSAEGVANTAAATANLATASAAINIIKGFDPVIVTGGVPSTLTLTLSNSSSITMYGVGFTDVFPTGIQVYSVPNVTSTCPGGSVTAIPGDGKISVSGITMAATPFSCNITVQTTSVKFLNLTNTIPKGAVVSDEGYTNPSAVSATLSTLQGLGIMKAFSPAYVTLGAETMLKMWLVSTFDPNAPTPLTLTGVEYTDTLPTVSGATVVVADPPSASTDCLGPTEGSFATVTADPNSNKVTISAATIKPNTVCMISVKVKAPADLGTYPNEILANAVTSDQGIPNQSPASANLYVVAEPTISKAFSPKTVSVGGVSTLTVTITNGAAIPITGISLSDPLPSGLAIAPAPAAVTNCALGSVTADPGTGTLSLSGATVPAGGSCTFSAKVVANTKGTYLNGIGDGKLVSNQGLTNNGATEDTLTVLDTPTVSKTFSKVSILAGETSELTLTLGNPNASSITLNSPGLVDALPGDVVVAPNNGLVKNCPGSVIAVPGSSTITYATGASIPAGGCTISVTVKAPTPGLYTNTIAAGQLSTSAGTNQTPASADLAVGPGALVRPTVSKAFSPGTIATGGTSTLTITLGNPNSSDLTLSSIFTDTLPGNVVVADPLTIGGTCPGTKTATAGGSTITYASGATIPPGGCTITVKVTSNTGGSYTNTIVAGALQTGGGSINAQPATAGLVVKAPVPPTVLKSFNPGIINPGGISRLTLNLGNSNSGDITLNSVLTDILPLGVTVATTPNPGGSCTAAAVGATAGATQITYAKDATIPPGGCTIQVDVTAISASTPYTNTIAVGDLKTSAGDNGAVATAKLFVNPPQPPSLSKFFTPSTILVNGVSTLTLSFGNGNAAATQLAVDLVDILPSNVKIATPLKIDGTGSKRCLGTVEAVAGGDRVTYKKDSPIPAGGCSVSVDVTSAVANETGHINTIAAGALQTGFGNSLVGTSATLTVLEPALLSGFVYVDSDGDGQQDAGETVGIPGVTVKLTGTDDLGAAVNLTRTTAADGSYSFTNLRPGTAYTVTETKPTAPATGVQVGTGSTVSDGAGTVGPPTATTQFVSDIGIAAGNKLINYNFGHVPLPPLAANDAATTNLNTPVTLYAAANDVAGVGGTLNLNSIVPAFGASWTVAGEGTFDPKNDGTGQVVFTPVNGFVGVVTVPYTISDQSTSVQVSNIANLTVTVRDAPNNVLPVANPDFATTPINTPVTLPVTINDAPGTGKTLTLTTVDLDPATSGRQTTVTVVGVGTWTANNDGPVIFAPANNFTGTATLPYTVQDSGGGTSNQATITVVVTGGPTVARNDSGTTTPITPITLSVLNNDEAATGCSFDPATLDLDTVTAGRQITVTTGQGTWNASDSGTVTFIPANGFGGTTTPQPYAVQSSCSEVPVSATITIIVNPTANPTAVNDAATTGFNTAVTLNPAGNDSASAGAVLNPSTVDLDPATPGVQRGPVSTAQGVWQVIDNAGTVRFTPANGYVGTTPPFPYAISDSLGHTATATMTVTVSPLPPVVGSVLGVVFNDLNGNGVQDSGEPGISGVKIDLFNSQSLMVATATTDANGGYLFSGIPVGSYTVQETDPSGYTSTTPNTVAVIVPANSSVVANFGDQQPGNTISGILFDDNGAGGGIAGNGLRDGSEPGTDAGASLYAILVDSSGKVAQTMTIPASGTFSFSGVIAGSYSVRISTSAGTVGQPAPAASLGSGWIPTGDSINGVSTTGVADGDLNLGTVSANLTTITIGGRRLCASPSTLTGLLWHDRNRDGVRQPDGADGIAGTGDDEEVLPGIVSLTPTGGTTAQIRVTTANAQGEYRFENITAGPWTVEVEGSYQSDILGLDPVGAFRKTYALAGCETERFDVGFAAPQGGGVGDFVWFDQDFSGKVSEFYDSNGDGLLTKNGVNTEFSLADFEWVDLNGNNIADAGEYNRCGLRGVTVELLDAQGAVLDSMSSGLRGGYGFTGLALDQRYATRVNRADPAIYGLAEQMAATGLCKPYPPVATTQGRKAGQVQRAAPVTRAAPSGCGMTRAAAQTSPVLTVAQPSIDTLDYGLICSADIQATLSLDKVLSGTVDVDQNGAISLGDVLRYTITATNTGNVQLSEVTVSDPLLTPSSTTCAELAPGATCVLLGSYTIQAADVQRGRVDNTATADTAETDPVQDSLSTPINGQGMIAGIVFNDLNNNGIQDPGEVGISGVTVTLQDTLGATVNTTTTNAGGQYSFSNVAAGSYDVVETDLAGYTSTTPNTVAVILPADGSGNANFGDRQPDGMVTGIVFNDLNNNGIQDAGEVGISGVTVTLQDALGATVRTATTGTDGAYQFLNLPTGPYTVRETDLAGYLSTTSNTVPVNVATATVAVAHFGDRQIATISGVVFNDLNSNGIQETGEPRLSGVKVDLLDSQNRVVATLNSDANGQYIFQNVNPGTYTVQETDPTGFVSTTPNTVTVTVPANGFGTANFGDRQIGTVSGVVFNDFNSNGVQDAAEPGISGVTVTLRNAQGATVGTTTTDSNGGYLFTGIAAGAYQVEESDPAGFVSTTVNSVVVTVPANGSATAHFGDRQTGVITGLVFNDLDGNGRLDPGEPGISGVTIDLLDRQGRIIATTVTASDGRYRFDNISAGDYTVRETDPTGFVSTTPNTVAVTVPANGSGNADFGDQTGNGLSGVVFNDLNNNGVRDPGEPSIGGVIVTLRNSAGTAVATITTSSNGYYLFTNLVPGGYTVEQTTPAGYIGTTPVTVTVAVPDNGAAVANFGNRQTGVIAGVVFNDLNGNRVQDPGEPGISGVTVTLQNAQGVAVSTTMTDGYGYYRFGDLAAGSYAVVETDPSGFVSTTPNSVTVILPADGSGNANFGDRQADVRLDFTAQPMCLNDAPYVDYQVVPIGVNAPNGVTLSWIKADGTTAQTLTNQPLTGRLLWPGAAVDASGVATAWPGWVLANGQWVQVDDGLRPTMNLVATVNPSAELTLTYPPVTAQCSANPLLNGQGAISGIVFYDLNGNRVQDPGESGISGLAITLRDADGNVVATTTTVADGSYRFTSLAPGRYTVTVAGPPGYMLTTGNEEQTATIILGQTAPTLPVGYQPPVAIPLLSPAAWITLLLSLWLMGTGYLSRMRRGEKRFKA